ncbi:unnamed protein product [Bemisia tabaci]|uniref:Ionotropic receptor n=1 Tax=Bemisia tabaci TaxID=7038 RepID=A0A9P0EXM3_BEMTA|nr:unnamed protein product [Bemisia tabaci]
MRVFYYSILIAQIVSGVSRTAGGYAISRLRQQVDNIPVDNRWESFFSVSLCRNIVKRTELKLFYTVEIDSDPQFENFIQDLHKSSIQTISITRHRKLTTSVVTDHSKNMIFFLDDVGQLFNLIFYTISSDEPNQEIVLDLERNERDYNQSRTPLPQYCIKLDEQYLWAHDEKVCSKEVGLKSSDLEGTSILSDTIVNATRDLYSNKIWNFKNHLIFMIKNFGRDFEKSMLKPLPNETLESSGTATSEVLTFCFKFFWRFFKGHMSVICHPKGCTKYLPFTEELVPYGGDTDTSFFDFSWKNMHEKSISIFYNHHSDRSTSAFSLFPPRSTAPYVEFAVQSLFEQSMNCTSKYYNTFSNPEFRDANSETGLALKFGIDLITYGNCILPTDHEKYDYSIGFDTNAVCIATPHSDYMPQSLVIFQGFKPVVWGFVAVTIVIFGFVQYLFQYSQCEVFHRLYTFAEIDRYRESSALLTVCAYFLCGSPPSLHLSHLLTGKVLFLIFSFSSIIISTVFLSSMTTLLSERVLYPEIDTLNSLEESDLLIQTLEGTKTVVTRIFDEFNQTERLKGKLVDGLRYYTALMVEDLILSYNLIDVLSKKNDEGLIKQLNDSLDNAIEKVKENIRLIVKTDAFLVGLRFTSTPQQNIRRKHVFIEEWFDYHLVRECLIKYTPTIPFLKGSFYFERYNQLLARHFETGHAGRILENDDAEDVLFVKPVAKDGSEPRAFNLNDLQSAFIGLTIGLFFSFLAFVGEVLTDHFQHSALIRWLMRLRKSFLKRVRKIV